MLPDSMIINDSKLQEWELVLRREAAEQEACGNDERAMMLYAAACCMVNCYTENEK